MKEYSELEIKMLKIMTEAIFKTVDVDGNNTYTGLWLNLLIYTRDLGYDPIYLVACIEENINKKFTHEQPYKLDYGRPMGISKGTIIDEYV